MAKLKIRGEKEITDEDFENRVRKALTKYAYLDTYFDVYIANDEVTLELTDAGFGNLSSELREKKHKEVDKSEELDFGNDELNSAIQSILNDISLEQIPRQNDTLTKDFRISLDTPVKTRKTAKRTPNK